MSFSKLEAFLRLTIEEEKQAALESAQKEKEARHLQELYMRRQEQTKKKKADDANDEPLLLEDVKNLYRTLEQLEQQTDPIFQ